MPKLFRQTPVCKVTQAYSWEEMGKGSAGTRSVKAVSSELVWVGSFGTITKSHLQTTNTSAALTCARSSKNKILGEQGNSTLLQVKCFWIDFCKSHFEVIRNINMLSNKLFNCKPCRSSWNQCLKNKTCNYVEIKAQLEVNNSIKPFHK